MSGEDIIALGILLMPLFLLVFGGTLGKILEMRHFKSIRAREANFLHAPAVTVRTLDDPRPVARAELVVGAAVVSVDHLKRFFFSFRKIFGGEVRSYSPLIDRGRREALLRMKESAPGAHLFMNCRMETSTIYNGKGKTTGAVELVAYGTAVTFAEHPPA